MEQHDLQLKDEMCEMIIMYRKERKENEKPYKQLCFKSNRQLETVHQGKGAVSVTTAIRS